MRRFAFASVCIYLRFWMSSQIDLYPCFREKLPSVLNPIQLSPKSIMAGKIAGHERK
jgi:hypothetical protein